jgi:hypothetical protein
MKCIVNRADDSTGLGDTFDSAHLTDYVATLETCYLPPILKMEAEDSSETLVQNCILFDIPEDSGLHSHRLRAGIRFFFQNESI